MIAPYSRILSTLARICLLELDAAIIIKINQHDDYENKKKECRWKAVWWFDLICPSFSQFDTAAWYFTV